MTIQLPKAELLVAAFKKWLGETGRSQFTVRCYGADVLRMLAALDGRATAVPKMRRNDLTGYWKKVLAAAAPPTAKRKLAASRSFATWLEGIGSSGEIVPPVSEVEYLRDDQQSRLLKLTSLMGGRREHAIFLFILKNGVTAEQLCELEWRDVRITRGGEARLEITHGTRRQVIQPEVSKELLNALISLGYIGQKGATTPFFRKEGHALTRRELQTIFEKYTRALKFKVNHTILRNTFMRQFAAETHTPRISKGGRLMLGAPLEVSSIVVSSDVVEEVHNSVSCAAEELRNTSRNSLEYDWVTTRANNRCQACGTPSDFDGFLEIHAMGWRQEEKTEEEMLVVLCPNCHAQVHRSPRRAVIESRLLRGSRPGAKYYLRGNIAKAE